MNIDKYTKDAQNAIESEQEEEEKIYLQLETLDQIFNLIPKRIRKEERQFKQDRFNLYSMAQQESMVEANLKNMKPFKIEDLVFPGEEFLFQQNNVEQGFINKVISLPQGINDQNLIKMKFNLNIPYEIQNYYNITYKPDENLELFFEEEQKNFDYTQKHLLKLKPKQDQEYLYSLAKQERLRKFNVKATNEYYLYTDIPPTQEDIEKRAQILAKLFCKYNLKETQEKIRKRDEEKMKIKHHQQIQMSIINKVLKNEDITKEDINKASTQISNIDQDVAALIREQKRQEKLAKQLANQPPPSEEKDNKETEEGQETKQGIQIQIQRTEQFRQQINLNNIGASQIAYSQDFEEQIKIHKQKIFDYYDNKITKYYNSGKLQKALELKKDQELKKRDFENSSNPEVLLRYLLYIRYSKQIF
ncbi:hypothetical protein ABPG72_007139 [Tetrahymena utriculariae]